MWSISGRQRHKLRKDRSDIDCIEQNQRRLYSRLVSLSPQSVSPCAESAPGEASSCAAPCSVLQFSSALSGVSSERGSELWSEAGDTRPGGRGPGNRLWPGEKRDLETAGGWNAEGKDFSIGGSPVIENMGLW